MRGLTELPKDLWQVQRLVKVPGYRAAFTGKIKPQVICINKRTIIDTGGINHIEMLRRLPDAIRSFSTDIEIAPSQIIGTAIG